MKRMLVIPLFALACSLVPAPAAIKLQNATNTPAPVQDFAVMTGAVNLRDNPDGLTASSVVAVLEAGVYLF